MTRILSWNLAARAAVFSAGLILATGISIGAVDMPGVGVISSAIAMWLLWQRWAAMNKGIRG